MKFCTNCGAKLADGSKFCTECGQPVASAAPAQEAFSPPQQAYAPPVQPAYESPIQQTYEPPTQQTYEPPAQPVYEPSEPSGGGEPPEPPVPPENTSGARKPVNKKIFLFAGIGIIVVLILVLLISSLAGGKEDPNLGRYNEVYYTYLDEKMDAEGDWIELKSGGKASLLLLGEAYNATWSLDGEQFTLTQSGDDFAGTLKKGILTVDYDGIVYTYQKEGQAAGQTPETPDIGKAGAEEAGYWTLLRIDSDDAEIQMSEENVASFKELGIEFFLNLNEDGTGVVVFDDPVSVTWGDGKIIDAANDMTLTYALADGLLTVDEDGSRYVFTRGKGTAPEVDLTQYAEGDEGDTPAKAPVDGGWENEPLTQYSWWDGKWYGWAVITAGSENFADMVDTCWDCTADIEVYSDDTGSMELCDLDGESFGYAYVSFGAGTTENGCMMSEYGSVFDTDLEHADWIIDPGASVVSSFDQMICINGTASSSDTDNWVDYYIFLRPWGVDWEDVRLADTSGMLYDDMMPLHYDDWYVPQLESGAPMTGVMSGDVATLDYGGTGEIFFDYPADRLTFDDTFGIDTLENSDGSLRMTFMADWEESGHEDSMDYLDGCSVYDEYEKEELTIGGYDAVRIRYIDDWGDFAENVYIYFGEDAGRYVGINIGVSASSKTLRDSEDVELVIASVRLKG